ncbi:flagellin [Asticcacaulis sp. AND118]|uniref:flagellin n=1 Tax=Asticcacaulis sp. AND118 TaxID=2840468 RepID=UPI001CFF89F2|nr:flagellin [Asticcacaulis sp. AND118]UDF03954.1 flagellin [Asticcacaulis sp. AND118]
MRISTGQMWGNALSNLMQAQIRKDEANNQVSTRKVATDFGGYGRGAEVIAAYQSSLERVNGYTQVAQSVSDRLDSQNVALERAGEGLATGKDGLMDAIASQTLDGLTTVLQSSYMAFADGLNYKHQGTYLFGGGNETDSPLAANNLTDLATTPAADTFNNGTVKKASKIDGTTTLQTGMLASDIGAEGVAVFRDIKAFIDANAPMQGQMTEAQQTELQALANRLGTAYTKMVDQTSLNGTLQTRVENTLNSLEGQGNSLTNLINTKTEVNMAEAYTKLEQADLTVQAAAQVVANLKSVSLLDLLR